MMDNIPAAAFNPSLITYSISFAALLVASFSDLKTREVLDWLNYGLVISGVALNLLFSVIYSNKSFLLNSILGLVIFFGIAYIMFYAGQWGGGDSKILMGLGAMIGIDVSFKQSQFLFGFFINSLFVGAIYGLLWSIILVYKNRQKFLKEFHKALSEKNLAKTKYFIITASLLLLIAFFAIKIYYVKIFVLSLIFLLLATYYLWAFVKAVEKSCMLKLVEPLKLTEGDWIANDVYIGRKYICGPKDLGIEKKQIRKLIEFYKRGKVKKILIKEGIPFVPSFFIAFVITLIFGNLVMMVL